MGIFRRISNAFARMMYGRNGVDKLCLTLVWGALLANLLSMLLLRKYQLPGTLLYWLSMMLWCYSIFRMFSKNLGKRREENQKFVNWIWRMKCRQNGARERRADKDHKYFTCKNCKTICRVPVGKGKVVITCPKCGAEIHGRT